MVSSVGNIGRTPELRKRIMYTLLLLAIYRVGVFITVPGVDRSVMESFMQGGSSGFLGLFNMFSGGALEQVSIFALGVMPYISASIILQLLNVVVPALDRLNKEGEQGRNKINQYTRYGTVLLSIVQGFFIATWLDGQNSAMGGGGTMVFEKDSVFFTISTVLCLTTGAVFIMWLGEQITERGIGNGISLIIFAGIVAGLPDAVVQTLSNSELAGGTLTVPVLLMILLIVLLVIAFIVFMERGQRRLPVHYAKKVVGNKMYGGQNTFLPLKVNTAGVIPPIFASSILLFPTTIGGLFPNSGVVDWLNSNLIPGQTFYNVIYTALNVFFCYFYTAVMFNPVDVADNMKKSGGFVPGIRAGKKTAEYIDRVLSRITFGGAAYISFVCLIPTFLQSELEVPFYFGGTALLIVVAVALDTVQQIESHLITRNYDGFSGKSGGSGRTRRRG